MCLKGLRQAQYGHIYKVISFGPFTGHHQTCISAPIKETVQSSV